jgi:Na+/H+ antiporter NhaD/arsenite permease-like protein
VPDHHFPVWSLLPFPILVLSIAVLPLIIPHLWEKHRFQALVASGCALPILWLLVGSGRLTEVGHSAHAYVSFIVTLGALYVTSGGIHVSGDLRATPRTNVTFLALGAVLASCIGTTGASMLLIRPLLRTNTQRKHTAHLVPFFILLVANAGGLLTPLGDPPLLVGYIEGVPFFWTLRLLPVWALYVGSVLLAFWLTDRRAYARETLADLEADRSQETPLAVLGKRNALLLFLVVPGALLPTPYRELVLIAIAVASVASTARDVHERNAFSYAPIIDVAIIFAGLFLCLSPVEAWLSAAAPSLPLRHSWQLFWGSGVLSSLLDNAPTYSAFTALARGLPPGASPLVAGVDPLRLAAVSAGSVVMGATTYIGNGPNLMVKAIAERAGVVMPNFARYALFAILVLLPGHVVMTLVLWLLER